MLGGLQPPTPPASYTGDSNSCPFSTFKACCVSDVWQPLLRKHAFLQFAFLIHDAKLYIKVSILYEVYTSICNRAINLHICLSQIRSAEMAVMCMPSAGPRLPIGAQFKWFCKLYPLCQPCINLYTNLQCPDSDTSPLYTPTLFCSQLATKEWLLLYQSNSAPTCRLYRRMSE